MQNYQSNSHRSKELQRTEAQQPEKRVQRVVAGKATTRKNEVRKIKDIFISEDAANVKSYIFMDVLVPAIKKAISDIVVDSIDMIFYGGSGGGRRKSSSGNKVSYRSYYDDRHDNRRESYRNPGRFDYEDIVLTYRSEAEAVRDEMMDCIERYGMVSVADMYDIAGLTPPHTANKYGWTSIRTAEVKRVRDGYILDLPKAMPFD